MSHVVAPSRNDCFSKEKVEPSFISTSLSQSLGDFNRLGKKHSWHFWPKSLLTILRGGPESRNSEIGCFCLQLKNMFNCIALLVNIRLNIGKFYEISRPLQIWTSWYVFCPFVFCVCIYIWIFVSAIFTFLCSFSMQNIFRNMSFCILIHAQ